MGKKRNFVTLTPLGSNPGFNEKELLDNPRKVSQKIAKTFDESEFDTYRIVQDRLFKSDFDRHIKKALEGGKEQL